MSDRGLVKLAWAVADTDCGKAEGRELIMGADGELCMGWRVLAATAWCCAAEGADAGA